MEHHMKLSFSEIARSPQKTLPGSDLIHTISQERTLIYVVERIITGDLYRHKLIMRTEFESRHDYQNYSTIISHKPATAEGTFH